MTEKVGNKDDAESKLVQCIKSIEAGGSKISAWSLSIVGGSLLAILSDGYLHPTVNWMKWLYLSFLLGWLFIAISLINGFRITRSSIATDLYTKNDKALADIFENCNRYFGRQLKFFQWGLGVFGLWLVLYLVWWVFSVLPVKT